MNRVGRADLNCLFTIVEHLKGQVRLIFSRRPYSHWSLAFSSPPQLKVEVTSRVQGRSFSHVTSLISAQVRYFPSVLSTNFAFIVTLLNELIKNRFTNGFKESIHFLQQECVISHFFLLRISYFYLHQDKVYLLSLNHWRALWKWRSFRFQDSILLYRQKAASAVPCHWVGRYPLHRLID